MIKVSVIVPVYNVEKYLSKCLDSLVNQTLKDIEIIVVNDGSPDNSQKIIDKYEKKYKNLKGYIKENGGLSDARNFGLKYAKGKYISFVDSDDYLSTETLEDVYNKMEENNSDIAIFDMVDHYANGFVDYHDCTTISFKYEKTSSACNKVFKRELIGNLEFYKGIWYEDLNFTNKLLAQTDKISYINKGYYNCFVRDNSIMASSDSEKNLDIILSIENLYEFLKKKKVKDAKEIYELFIMKDILIGSIPRMSSSITKNNKKYIKKLIKYSRENVSNYRNNKFYKYFSFKKKVIIFFNYHKMYFVPVLISKIKKLLKRGK